MAKSVSTKPTHFWTLRLLAGAIIMTGYSAAPITAAQEIVPEASASKDHLDRLRACQSITGDSERLSCYDNAVGQVVAASDQGEVRIVAAEEVLQTRKRLFGFSLPKIGLFGGDGDKEKIDLLESVITKVSRSGRNIVFITIEEGGAVWRIPNAEARAMRAKPGDKVVFKEASMGSYFIRINGQNGVKGRRVE